MNKQKTITHQVDAVVIWHYPLNQRVKRDEKTGTIIERYSKPQYQLGSVTLGPYPELYRVQFDDKSIGNAFFWWGITPI